MLQCRLKNIIFEVFKAQKGLSPIYIQEIFKKKDQPYFLRNPIPLIQDIKDSTNYGLKTFGYLGSRLWNDLPSHLKNIMKEDVLLFKSQLKDWPGPDQKRFMNPLL